MLPAPLFRHKGEQVVTCTFLADENSAVDNVLNFGGLLGAIVVGDGGEVEFRNLTLSNPGPLEIGRNTTNYVNNRCVSLGIWPSLVVLDGATVCCQSFSQPIP